MSALVLAVGLAVCAFFLGGSGVERAMAAAPASATSVTVKATVTAANFARLDNTIRSRTAGALGTPAKVTSTLRSDAYAMPGQEKRDKPERLRFDTFDGIQDHARLVAGTWPASRAEPVEAAISQQAAAYTGFRAGQVVSLLGRIDGKYLKVKITGVYALRDPFGPRWAANQMISRGVEWDWYTTFGPLVVDRATFLDHFAGFQVDATWTVEPDLRGLSADRLSAIAARLGGLRADFERNQCPDCTPFSALPGTLAALESASAVARWTVVGLAAALAVAFLLASRRALSAGLAVAVLTCVAAVGGTWLTSVQDQRRFQVGAEVRLSGESDRSPGGGAVPGFSGRVEVNGAFVTLVALDAARLPQVYGLRPDLSERPLAELARGLERDLGAGTPIPGRPRSLSVQAEGPVPLELVVSDGLGVWRHLPLQPGANQLDVSAMPAPLAIRGLLGRRVDGSPQTGSVTSIAADGRALAVPLSVRVGDSGASAPAMPATEPLPIVISADLARSTGLAADMVATTLLEREPVRVRVAGVVEHLPGTPRGMPGVLADWSTLQTRNLAEAKLPLPVTDWWAPGQVDAPAELTPVERIDVAAPLTWALWWALGLTALAALALTVSGTRSVPAGAVTGARSVWWWPVVAGAAVGVGVSLMAAVPVVRGLQVPEAIPPVLFDGPWVVLGVVLAGAALIRWRLFMRNSA